MIKQKIDLEIYPEDIIKKWISDYFDIANINSKDWYLNIESKIEVSENEVKDEFLNYLIYLSN